ncbi:hypothetical protein CEXT_81181 [Caerostris extrusa]|uniref:Uncharacterized protein n=1 Tax=Caerostris extrusa TaxID=172846 RepID=A0AAV4VCL6_CAEEX|nr:hypothetical protein CEXT_81181 [Caerostris extrusa]
MIFGYALSKNYKSGIKLETVWRLCFSLMLPGSLAVNHVGYLQNRVSRRRPFWDRRHRYRELIETIERHEASKNHLDSCLVFMSNGGCMQPG